MTVTSEPRIGAVALRAALRFLPGTPEDDYLLGERGFSSELIAEWQLGLWTPQALDVLTLSGFSQEEIDNFGLGSRMFRRITFPLLDSAGRPVGMAGRMSPLSEPTAT